MKLAFTILIFLITQTVFASGLITASRNGEAKLKQKNETNLIEIALNTVSVSDDVPKKYIVLSNGIVTEPVISGNCRAFQVFQVSYYMGQVGSVIIDVESEPNKDCSSEVQKIINADSIKVNFTTALLGDGSGDDAAPILLQINK